MDIQTITTISSISNVIFVDQAVSAVAQKIRLIACQNLVVITSFVVLDQERRHQHITHRPLRQLAQQLAPQLNPLRFYQVPHQQVPQPRIAFLMGIPKKNV